MPNTHQKKVEVVMLISDKVDFRRKKSSVTKQDIMQCTRVNCPRDVTMVNVYSANKRATKYTRQKWE